MDGKYAGKTFDYVYSLADDYYNYLVKHRSTLLYKKEWQMYTEFFHNGKGDSFEYDLRRMEMY